MGKNKKRNKGKKTKIAVNQTTKELPPWAEKLKPSSNLPPEDRQKAVERLKQLMLALSTPPETVLEMLDRLEIPYETINFQEWCADKPLEGERIVIDPRDIEEGEKRNEGLIKRIYKDDTKIVSPTVEVREPEEYVVSPTTQPGGSNPRVERNKGRE